MRGLERGSPTPERHEGRARLSVRDPRIETLLAGISIEGFNVEQTRSWGNGLLRARDAWSDRNRHGRRYSDRETAERNRLAKGGAR